MILCLLPFTYLVTPKNYSKIVDIFALIILIILLQANLNIKAWLAPGKQVNLVGPDIKLFSHLKRYKIQIKGLY